MQTNHIIILLLSLVTIVSIIAPVSALYTEADLAMNGTYTFTGTLVDSATGAAVLSATISDNIGWSTSITTGTFSNTYAYGTYTFSISNAPGYETKTATYLIDEDMAENITLTASTGSNQVVYTTPHKVRFICHDVWGAPIPDMSISVYGVQTTLGSLDWVATLFGINLDTTPVTNLMGGSTGSDGSITFVMLETEKYAVYFTKPSAQINETRYYYPMESEYTEVFWPENAAETQSAYTLSAEFTNTTINSTHINVGVNYYDSGNTTTTFLFFVDNKSSVREYTQYVNGTGIANVSYDLQTVNGGGVFWGYVATNTRYAKPVADTRYLGFADAQWLINPLKASNGDTAAVFIYNGAAVAFVLLFSFIFGRASIKFGAVVVPLMGLFFSYIGWLQTPLALITVAAGFGILLYFRYSEEEAGV